MEAHEYYKKETGKLYYKEAALELELTDDYINWLERNVVKLFAIPAVEERSEQLKVFMHFAEFTKEEYGLHIPLNLMKEYVKSL